MLCDIFSSCINLILHRLGGCPDCMHYEIINCSTMARAAGPLATVTWCKSLPVTDVERMDTNEVLAYNNIQVVERTLNSR